MRVISRFQKNQFFLLKNNFLYVLDCFDTSILKIIFLKKNIIFIHFGMKNILKNNHNHTPKQVNLGSKSLKIKQTIYVSQFYFILFFEV
jgi:hypothetical protein